MPEQWKFAMDCAPIARAAAIRWWLPWNWYRAQLSWCRDQGVTRLLVNVTGLEDVPIPTLVDRFLMVEDWAQESKGTVVVVLVASPEYIHPRKFGVKVAASFGLICDVYTSEEAASNWLLESETHTSRFGE